MGNMNCFVPHYIKKHFQEKLWFPAVSSPVIIGLALKQGETPALTFHPVSIRYKNNFELHIAKISCNYLHVNGFVYCGIGKVSNFRKCGPNEVDE